MENAKINKIIGYLLIAIIVGWSAFLIGYHVGFNECNDFHYSLDSFVYDESYNDAYAEFSQFSVGDMVIRNPEMISPQIGKVTKLKSLGDEIVVTYQNPVNGEIYTSFSYLMLPFDVKFADFEYDEKLYYHINVSLAYEQNPNAIYNLTIMNQTFHNVTKEQWKEILENPQCLKQ